MVRVLKEKLTVIMATYNADKFLDEAMQSLSSQTYKNFIVKIIDDNSNDTTVSILEEWIKKDSRFELVKINKQNLGLTRNLNSLIKLCDTEYVARMDADDVCLPERFKKQIQFLEQNEDTFAVGTWAFNINEDGALIQKRYVPTDNNSIIAMIGKASPIIHPTVMMRTLKLKQLNGYNENYRVAQDYNLWFRCLANNYKLANLPEILLYYRVINGHVTKRKMKHRLVDASIRWDGTKQLNFPFCKRVFFTSIPIILGLMPDFVKKIAMKHSNNLDPRQRLGNKEESDLRAQVYK